MSTDFPLSEGEDAPLLHVAQTAFFGDRPKRIGIAVSGGSDSMAVLHLFARAATHRGCTVHAVTVNHGLRPESADEAAHVAKVCAGLGVSHDTVLWEHDEISGNLQDQARRARYRLIAGWAKANKITHVALGHTADDQAETFLMRLARAAGVDGLAGMRRNFEHDKVRFGRPYLFRLRSDLRAYLTRNDVVWIEDPSNADESFERVKARKVLDALHPLGISVETLSAVSVHLFTAKSALDHYTIEAAEKMVVQDCGDLVLSMVPTPPIPGEIERRLLIAALMWVSGAAYPPRHSAMIELDVALIKADTFTLSGCLLTVDRQNGARNKRLRITREWNAVQDHVTRTNQIWDGRWALEGPHAPDLEIRALGELGLRSCPEWRESGLPRLSLLSSPSVWENDTLIAAPLAGFSNGWRAELAKSAADFHEFLKSH